jgi:hypothetical protein
MDESTFERSRLQVPPPSSNVLVLFQRARELGRRLSLESTAGSALDAGRVRFAQAAQRLTDCVIRPLNDVLTGLVSDESSNDEDDVETSGRDVIDSLCRLAKDATTLSSEADASGQMMEAAAGLQDIACRLVQTSAPENVATLVRELRALQSTLPVSVRVLKNGPYLLTNVE